jgi:HEPN domain-containing protein
MADSYEILLEKALADFNAARYLFETKDYAQATVIAFHCQQCVEKWLKAFLLIHDIQYPRTHDLEILFGLAVGISPIFEKYQSIANILSEHAVITRYTEGIDLDREEIEEMLVETTEFKEFIQPHLR